MEKNDEDNILHTRYCTTASAPGKALIAGGYLVLESPNPGLVVATDSCFHVTIAHRPEHTPSHNFDTDCDKGSILVPFDEGIENTSSNFRYFPLDVYSPQFHEVYTYWIRIYDCDSDGANYGCAGGNGSDKQLLQLIPRYRKQPTNSYVEKTIVLAMSFVLLRSSPSTASVLDQVSMEPTKDDSSPKANSNGSLLALAIKLRADNDFYSPIPHLDRRNLKYLPSEVSSLPKFLPCLKEEGNEATGAVSKVTVHKTGLGSSAALVTSLIAALLAHFRIVNLPSTHTHAQNTSENNIDRSKRIIHNLAQICHSIAQGKIGSGFDVSAAVHGTHAYTRFQPGLIQEVMDDLTKGLTTTSRTEVRLGIAKRLCHRVVGDGGEGHGWNVKSEPFALPKGIELMMADVCGGSESPSMAKKVLAWKRQRKSTTLEASSEGIKTDDEWEGLQLLNRTLKGLFEEAAVAMKKVDNLIIEVLASKRLEDCFGKTINSPWSPDESIVDNLTKEVMDLSHRTIDPSNRNPTTRQKEISSSLRNVVLPTLYHIRNAVGSARKHLKRMGEKAGVPVEPDEQTALADATMDLPGVVCAGVPGAGGYDALFVLYIESEGCSVRTRIGRLWMEWCEKEKEEGKRGLVCPLACKSAAFGSIHGLHQSDIPW